MISVDGLVASHALGLSFLAGASGGHRLVTWAHAVDLPDPWRWVAAGNLVMTTGAGLPDDPRQQVDWLERLAATNASALVIAPRPDAPAISREMLEAAERRMFPLLAASFELEFVRLSRLVIESVLQAQRERFDTTQRLFQAYASALREEPDMAARLSRLGTQLGARLQVEDSRSGLPIIASLEPAATSQDIERIEIPGRARAILAISRPHPRVAEDPLLVRTLAGLLSVELERQMIERDERRHEGEALLDDLLHSETDIATARTLLERRGLQGTLLCLAIRPAGNANWSAAEIQHAPELQGLAPLIKQEDILLMVVPDREVLIQSLVRHLGEHSQAGASGPITAAAGLPESVRQARLALAQHGERQTGLLRYGSIDTGPTLGPKTVAEARALIGRYLGPLIEYDRCNTLSLLDTLATFLDNDMAWKTTAATLGIHRQTLVYRLKVIEQLTGLKPTSTSGSARFWLTLQAARSTGLLARPT